MIGYIEELPGYIGLKIGYLNVFTHVLHCLEGIGEVRVTAYQYCNVIEINPGEMQQVCGQHNIDALFYTDTLR